LRCPFDRSDLIVIEHKKIELDYCLRCSGVWFDAGELELLTATLAAEIHRQPANDLLSLSPAAVKERRRSCPICNKKMDKVWLGRQPRILLDHCPLGHGLWFDGGELQQLLKEVLPAGSEGIISFLSDTFTGVPRASDATG
jgi:Zn-finger nucleic acid-binding protein